VHVCRFKHVHLNLSIYTSAEVLNAIRETSPWIPTDEITCNTGSAFRSTEKVLLETSFPRIGVGTRLYDSYRVPLSNSANIIYPYQCAYQETFLELY